jgi:hypothetical protein
MRPAAWRQSCFYQRADPHLSRRQGPSESVLAEFSMNTAGYCARPKSRSESVTSIGVRPEAAGVCVRVARLQSSYPGNV